jgi:hypothetical protein
VRALQDLCNYNTIKRKFHKKTLFIENFLCFATFVVQNLPARGRKTEKNKEMALAFKEDNSFVILFKLRRTKCIELTKQ